MTLKFKGESFFIKGGEKAVLLIHGLTATTQEVENIGLELAQNNFTVCAPLLKGHNRTFEEFKKTSAKDYFDSVLKAYNDLKNYKSIDVIGLSFGATLALHLASREPVNKIVTLAPAIFYSNQLVKLAPILKIYSGKVMKRPKTNPQTGIKTRWDLFKPDAIRERIAYPWFAFPQLKSTLEFIQEVKGELPKIKNPILIIHSKLDKTTKPESSEYIFSHIGSKDKNLIWLKKSGHIITVDYEEELVKRRILDFLLDK